MPSLFPGALLDAIAPSADDDGEAHRALPRLRLVPRTLTVDARYDSGGADAKVAASPAYVRGDARGDGRVRAARRALAAGEVTLVLRGGGGLTLDRGALVSAAALGDMFGDGTDGGSFGAGATSAPYIGCFRRGLPPSPPNSANV